MVKVPSSDCFVKLRCPITKVDLRWQGARAPKRNSAGNMYVFVLNVCKYSYGHIVHALELSVVALMQN